MALPASPASLALFLALCAAGCGGEEEGGHLVVGLTTDLAVGFDIRRVEATAKVDGVVAHAESRSYSKGKLSLPTEIEVPPAPDGAEVEVSIAAFRDGETSPLVARTAATRATIGRTLLLPVSLDEACSAVACAGGATCMAGEAVLA